MPKIPIVSAKKLIKVLKKKGFEHHRSKGSHQIFVHHQHELSVVVPVHPGQDLGRGITLAILKDANISTDEFIRLV